MTRIHRTLSVALVLAALLGAGTQALAHDVGFHPVCTNQGVLIGWNHNGVYYNDPSWNSTQLNNHSYKVFDANGVTIRGYINLSPHGEKSFSTKAKYPLGN